MAFPQTPLDVRTELQIGGVWTDITADVYTREPITITRGTADEATSADPSGCSLTLNNRAGKYSPRNPMSPYYGAIGRNTPVRVSVPGSESYLRLAGTPTSYARTPDAAALDITGDLDIRIEATVDWYAQATRPLIGKYTSGTNQRSYMLRLQSGVLTLWWSTDGGPSTTFFASQPLPALPPRAAVRATLDVNNGAGGFTARLYWAESLAGPWTQIGDELTVAGVTSIYSGTAPLEIAPPSVNSSTSLPGRVHRAEVRSGINGTVVASPDLRALAEGTTSWADTAGRTWTLTGSDISKRQYRFHGEISSWPPRWDVSGKDVWVPVTASGPTRRMGQGKKALDSTLRRRIPSDPSLIAYWPMEDGQDAKAAYSPIPGVKPLTLTGVELGADDSLGGASTVAKVGNPATLQGTVKSPATQGWQVEWVYNLPTMPALQTEIMRVAVSGSVMRVAVVYASTAGIRIEAQDSNGSVLAFVLYSDATALADFWGRWNRLAIYTSDNGSGTTRLYASWRDIAADARYYATTSFTGTQGAVTGVAGAWGSTTADMLIGHLAVFNVPAATGMSSPPGSTIFTGADDGFTGETALARLKRLAVEEAGQVALSVRGEDFDTPAERLGPQRPGVFLDLVEEAAETDGGILYERRDQLGALEYRDRQSLYNQTIALALDYLAPGEVPPPLEPTEDDQKLRNDVTVTRNGGSSARSVLESGLLSVQPPPAGVGPYDESLSLSLYSDDQPGPIAQWRRHLGTWDEARYPTITVWLHAAPHLIDKVLAMDIGDRLTITRLPAWLPPGLIDQHMRGYTEVLDQYEWSLALNCTPAGPWTIGVYDDPATGRFDTGGSALSAGVTTTATALSVTVSDATRWTTDPTHMPFAIQVGGEEMTVTAISGTGSPQTMTVVRSVNGIVKSHSAGADLRLARPTRYAL
ncbi:hypothetical protein OHB07_16130 [Streptomyces sp. NBC_00111]|uniref:hypothetical protein n=1 Tax=Streptomyces sp. NBC_00111 TaxID=2975655 RepID=UPI0032450A26